ncbi:hypothetical protein [Ralstonia insidiosa]|uniref:Uncharacterized protein n=1 Tax=Ralstonia insidiosa TaxID=190721 RepID=A0A848PE64_9RALS|nr:hypothetical protein [Ralstonia insidiosa]NMV41818.1 hypothetical protein [Ralstonia insidiosa]
MRKVRNYLNNSVALSLALLGLSGPAAAQAGYALMPIHNGVNALKLRGYDAIAVRAWRENFNAHSFDVVTFFVRDGAAGRAQPWSLVPVFRRSEGGGSGGSGEQEQLHVTTGGGADCLLHDFRLLLAQGGKPAVLILANREAGASYAADANVRFDYYVLTENANSTPGYPKLSFRWQKSQPARAQYCDVNRAFDQELHLGTSSGTANVADAP